MPKSDKVTFLNLTEDSMASVTCQRCNSQYAVIGCDECKTLVCTNCSAACQSCGVSICLDHTHLTKGGRKLCHRCIAERAARRAALKQKYRAGGASNTSQPTAPAAPTPPARPPGQQAPPAGGRSPFAANQGARFADIAGSKPLIPIKETEEELNEEAGLGQEHEDPEMRLDPEEAERNRKARETAQFTSTGRLELPPMDENRAVLGQSGYQPPSRTKVFAAFVFFGIAMVMFYRTTPYFKDTLFPWDTTELQFNKGEMAQIQDTNKIRNTSNLQQFDIIKQAPIFFVSWFLVLLYGFGVLILVVGIIRSSYWSYIAKRNLEASQNLNKDNNQLKL
jgi:hypothetical protein